MVDHLVKVRMMRIYQTLCVLTMSVLTSAHAAQVNTVHVNPKQPSFQVSLPANPTTGFQWQVQRYDHSLLSFLSQRYSGPKTRLMGAGGQTVFQFKLKKLPAHLQSTSLVFKYSRPWEPATGTVTKVKVIFDN